jgi:hypothetical protein
MASKKQLLGFLDIRVFNPIPQARRDDYKESQQKALADVQEASRSEQKRFHSSGKPAGNSRQLHERLELRHSEANQSGVEAAPTTGAAGSERRVPGDSGWLRKTERSQNQEGRG